MFNILLTKATPILHKLKVRVVYFIENGLLEIVYGYERNKLWDRVIIRLMLIFSVRVDSDDDAMVTMVTTTSLFHKITRFD